MAKKKKYNKEKVYTARLISFVLLLCVVFLYIFISSSDLQSSMIDESTSNYISFNNLDTTDILKISNLKRIYDSKGKSNHNTHYKEFQIQGDKGSEFQVVLYHVGTNIDEKYVKFYLSHKGKEVVFQSLDQMEETVDGGRILYSGVIENHDSWNLRMWIDHSYKGDVKNISYEIRIR